MEMSSAYLNLNPKVLKTIVNRVSKKLKTLKKKLKFDTIVIRGNSGTLVGYPVSIMTGIPVVLVRKDKESSHGDSIEGSGNMVKYIILDDFIFSGGTVDITYHRIQTHAKDRQHADVKCVGIALYANDTDKKMYRVRLPRDKSLELPVFSV